MDTMILAPVVVATLIGLFVVGDLLIFKIGVKLFRREEARQNWLNMVQSKYCARIFYDQVFLKIS